LFHVAHSTQVAGKKGESSAGKETEDSKGQTSHTMNRLSYLVSQNNIYISTAIITLTVATL